MKTLCENIARSVLRQDTVTRLTRNKTAFCLLAILILSLFLFFFNLGSYSLKEPDEGRYAEIPREMVEQGNYVVPHLNYVRYFEKPPLLYWITALSFKVFGANEWSFRLPNALVALLGVVITYLFAARWFSTRTGFLAALMLMSCFGFIALARIVTTDMLFSCLLSAALFSFLEFFREKRPSFLYLFYVASAFSVLAKGPVAIVLLGATIVLFLVTEKRVSFLREMASAKAVILFVLVAAPWFVAVSVAEKGFFHFFFVDQHLLRFLTKKHRRSGPLYYFIPVLFGGLFPWSVFIPRALHDLWKRKELRLLLIWSAVVFAFFSVSGSKLPPYILPIFPALCIVLAQFFSENWERSPQTREKIIYTAFFVLTGCAGIACALGLVGAGLGLSSDAASLLRGVRGFSWAVAGVSLVTACSLAFGKIRTFRAFSFLLGGFSFALVIALMLHAHVIDGLNTAKALAGHINKTGGANAIVVNYGGFDETLPFYLKRKTIIAAYTGELEMGSGYDDARSSFVDEEGLRYLLGSERNVWIVFKEKRLGRIRDLGIGKETAPLCVGGRCVIAAPR